MVNGRFCLQKSVGETKSFRLCCVRACQGGGGVLACKLVRQDVCFQNNVNRSFATIQPQSEQDAFD